MAVKFYMTDTPLQPADYDLIAGFLNENFETFKSHCEESDADANQIVDELESLANN